MRFGFKKATLAFAPAAIGAALAIGATALPAGAAPLMPPGGCSIGTATDFSYVSPIHGGQALNANNWGGSGSKATACTGAVSNDNIKTWKYSGAGVASDFTPFAVAGTALSAAQAAACTANGATGCVQLEYTPGRAQSGLCISTVLDLKGAFARLRPCGSSGVGATVNQWQDFALVPEGDGFWQIEAVLEPTPYSLNIKGFGGSGTQVISWSPMVHDAGSDSSSSTVCSENEIFEVLSAS